MINIQEAPAIHINKMIEMSPIWVTEFIILVMMFQVVKEMLAHKIPQKKVIFSIIQLGQQHLQLLLQLLSQHPLKLHQLILQLLQLIPQLLQPTQHQHQHLQHLLHRLNIPIPQLHLLALHHILLLLIIRIIKISQTVERNSIKLIQVKFHNNQLQARRAVEVRKI